MEFYQFPLFSFLLLPSYILPRFRGKDCLLPLLVQDEWRKAEYSESDLQQPDHQNLFLHFPPEAAGRSAVHPLLSSKIPFAKYINMEPFHAVCFCNPLHRFLYTKDLSSVFQQHFTDSGCQFQHLSAFVHPLAPCFRDKFLSVYHIFLGFTIFVFEKKIPVLIEIIPKLRYNE